VGSNTLESSLTKAYTIKIQNFEGPFDLLFHLIEKNQINIYDIPINEITDQYMEYLFAMQELNLEVASEFLLMAATLLHIKSRMLLPDRKEKNEEALDPREELIYRLVEYKKYKKFAEVLKVEEKNWEKVFYKLPEAMEFEFEEEVLELQPLELKRAYKDIIERNRKKINNTSSKMSQIIQHEKVSLKSKIREIIRTLINRPFFRFSELFSQGARSKTEIVTGFLGILELSKQKRVNLKQSKQFSDIFVHRCTPDLEQIQEDEVAAGSDPLHY
jgi:segregation and condensation protein A